MFTRHGPRHLFAMLRFRRAALAALIGLATLVGPKVLRSAEPAGRLGYWRFNSPDLRDEQGRPPLAVSNTVSAPGIDGTALRFADSTQPRFVRYGAVTPTGVPVLAPREGSIRFLYRPEWIGEGQSPGRWLRLFEAGSVGSGGINPQWLLSIDPAGTNLVVQTRNAQGGWRTNLQVRVDWQRAFLPGNAPGTPAVPITWREVIFNYNANTCALVVDGAVQQDWQTSMLVGNGPPPLTAAPGTIAAFSVGAALDGSAPAGGLIDELETYDRAVSPLRSYHYLSRAGLSAEATLDPPAIRLSWYSLDDRRHVLRRFEMGTTNVVQLAQDLGGMSFTDTNDLHAGSLYLYALDDRSLLVSFFRPPVDGRGRVILLVDRTLAPALRAELERLQTDLAGDGFSVVRHDVPRHRDGAWSGPSVDPAYRSELALIKSEITADYRQAPDQTVAVLLLGHVVIPYSGLGAEDGHIEHFGAWPADSYYGDIEGNWTDATATTRTNVTHVLLRNVPGDGKFDAFNFPPPAAADAPRTTPGLDMAVGRVDFAGLPAFKPLTETELLRRYLDKNHRYRLKELAFERSLLVGAYFGNPYHNESVALYDTANVMAASVYRPRLDTVADGNAFAGGPGVVWAIQGGYGDPTALHNSADMNNGLGIRRVSTAELAQGNPAPAVGFYLLKGSYFGDWNFTDDNLMKALLALPDSGLATIWTRVQPWAMEMTGLGDPLAAAIMATARGPVSARISSILGDPTLRAFVTMPPTGVTANRSGPDSVTLRWKASKEATQGYLVYRSQDGVTGNFIRMSQAAVMGTEFTDPAATAARLTYQIRACQLVTTGAGAFTNTSQAAWAEVPAAK